MEVRGRIIEGKGIASGRNTDEKGLTETIKKQKPFFERVGIAGIENIFPGTVNMDISPKEFQIDDPDYVVRDITWGKDKEGRPVTESFQFVATKIIFEKNSYDGYIYYPMKSEERPDLKSHPDTRIELLAPRMPGIDNGKKITIFVPDGKISIKDPPQQLQ